MDTINAGSLGEREQLIPIRDEARRRLNRARQRIAETQHLPPGDEDRDAAVRELRLALAVGAEMGI
jgi:hypothetical protein